jgi:integrase
MPQRRARAKAGIEIRHARTCATRQGRACTCTPSYRATAWSKRDGRLIRRTFNTEAEARLWREDARVDLRRGVLVAPKPTTVRQFGDRWLTEAEEGNIRNRSGDRYKPSTLRGYEQALREYIYPHIGGKKLQELKSFDVQRLADELVGAGLRPSTVRNALLPLRAICRRALRRGDLNVNPTIGVELPAVRGRRMRIVVPAEAQRLVDTLPESDRALWATAFYTGLRRGELQALGWAAVDLAAGIIDVERSWDQKQGLVEPKSIAGRRRVPVPAVLRDYLVQHRIESEHRGLVFGRSVDRPFNASTIMQRARRAWKEANVRGVTLHDCRHTFASLMIAAGVNAKALQTFMGHSSITVTLDRYGHLFPGSEEQAAALLDAYLAEAYERARQADAQATAKH